MFLHRRILKCHIHTFKMWMNATSREMDGILVHMQTWINIKYCIQTYIWMNTWCIQGWIKTSHGYVVDGGWNCIDGWMRRTVLSLNVLGFFLKNTSAQMTPLIVANYFPSMFSFVLPFVFPTIASPSRSICFR